MDAVYEFIADRSRILPLGVILAGLAAFFSRTGPLHRYGAGVFLVALIATLCAGAFERQR
ncbi:MAG: hypothetical protein DLM50_01410 [Candidatus Meridianibacter frigidus]|nr:MAG: hypothetical protein DLM50_01410 [Candidatus Eremiobacteraeota bacterium]